MATPRSAIFKWTPGRDPEPSDRRALAPALTWVDFSNELPTRMEEAATPLELPGLHPQYLRHLFSNVDPDDRDTEHAIDNFDAGVAEELVNSENVYLFQAFEPVAVEYSGAMISLALCRIGFLAGDHWLVTYRAAPFDARYSAGGALEPTPRNKLIQAAREFARTDQTSVDLAMLMLHYVARRSSTVASELRDEIGNRMVDFHRAILAEAPADAVAKEVRSKLFDLRWALDSLERSIRPYTGPADSQTERWYSAGSDAAVSAQVREGFTKAVSEARDARRALEDALVWMTTENTSRTLDRQVEAQEQTAILERVVGILSVYVLGPALVAAIFGAFPNWFESEPLIRALLMLGLMVGVAIFAGFGLRRLSAKPDAAIGPLGTPVYGWALKLGIQINRQAQKAARRELGDPEP